MSLSASLHENWDLKHSWLPKARFDAPRKYMVRKKVKKVYKNYFLKINCEVFRLGAKIPEEQQQAWTISKKSLCQAIFWGNLFYFMVYGLRCHLGNRLMKRLFIKECWIDSMRGSGKHFKKPKPCLFYHSSWGIMFPDLWSLACSSLRSNLLVPASKAARLYLMWMFLTVN